MSKLRACAHTCTYTEKNILSNSLHFKCTALWLYGSISAIIITVLGTKAGIKVFESFVFPNRNISSGHIKLT